MMCHLKHAHSLSLPHHAVCCIFKPLSNESVKPHSHGWVNWVKYAKKKKKGITNAALMIVTTKIVFCLGVGSTYLEVSLMTRTPMLPSFLEGRLTCMLFMMGLLEHAICGWKVTLASPLWGHRISYGMNLLRRANTVSICQKEVWCGG